MRSKRFDMSRMSPFLLASRLPRNSGTTGDSLSSGDEDPQPANDQIPSQRELEAKIQCAATFLAWSKHRDNAHRLVKVQCTPTSLPTLNAVLPVGSIAVCSRNIRDFVCLLTRQTCACRHHVFGEILEKVPNNNGGLLYSHRWSLLGYNPVCRVVWCRLYLFRIVLGRSGGSCSEDVQDGPPSATGLLQRCLEAIRRDPCLEGEASCSRRGKLELLQAFKASVHLFFTPMPALKNERQLLIRRC